MTGTKASQADLAAWAKQSLRLERQPNQSTINNILRNAHRIRSMPISRNPGRKKAKPATARHLKDALYRVICNHSNRGVFINSEIICVEGQRLNNDANALLLHDQHLQLTFSKSWIEQFKKRHNLSFRRVHEGLLSAYQDAITNYIPRVRQFMVTNCARYIWNADKCGLFYQQSSRRTLCEKIVAGHKKEKLKLTFLLCCNADGSEKMPLRIISYAQNA